VPGFLKPSECKKVLVCLRLDYILSKTITWFYFHENENSTHQTEQFMISTCLKGLTTALASGGVLILNPVNDFNVTFQ